MLSTAYIITQKQSPEMTNQGIVVRPIPHHAVRDILLVFVLLLVIDIAILVYAIHSAISCGQANNWPTLVVLLLILLMFAPGVGFVVQLGVIIYHLASGCDKPKLAFSFY